MLALLAAGASLLPTTIADQRLTNTSQSWMSSLRRQLMRDNYDYIPSETEEQFPTVPDEVGYRRNKLDDTIEHHDLSVTQSTIDDVDDFTEEPQFTINSVYIPRFRAEEDPRTESKPAITKSSEPAAISQKDELPVARKDLFYYVDDERLAPTNKEAYRLIKVPVVGGRRQMPARFVEARGENGVAMLSVDGAPFPEFRLPAARRQFQAPDSEEYTLIASRQDDSPDT